MSEDLTTATIPKQNVVKLLMMICENKSSCRACGRPIYWVKMKSGKLNPITDEGISHFSDCPQAGNFRRQE